MARGVRARRAANEVAEPDAGGVTAADGIVPSAQVHDPDAAGVAV